MRRKAKYKLYVGNLQQKIDTAKYCFCDGEKMYIYTNIRPAGDFKILPKGQYEETLNDEAKVWLFRVQNTVRFNAMKRESKGINQIFEAFFDKLDANLQIAKKDYENEQQQKSEAEYNDTDEYEEAYDETAEIPD